MSDKPLVALAALSLLTNGVLALFWPGAGSDPLGPKTHRETPSLVISNEPPRPALAQENRPPAVPPLDWRTLESDNIAEYATNLRRAGFPETAIRDALLPLVAERTREEYQRRVRGVFAPRWAKQDPAQAEALAEELETAEDEKRQLLQEAFALEEHQVQGYRPWDFRCQQANYGSFKDKDRERLEEMKRERTALRLRIQDGLAPQADLEALISTQEREIAEHYPEEFARQLLAY